MAEPNDRDRLTGLVQFAAELLRGRDKTVMALRDYGLGVFHEKDLAPLPGLVRGEGDSWLKVERLRQGAGPACPSEFNGWIEGDMDRPTHPPESLAEHALLMTLEEASDLAEDGFVTDADVSPCRPLDAGADHEAEAPPSRSHVEVVLRIALMPEWRAAFEQWLTLVWRPWAEVEGPRRRTMEVYEILYRLHSMTQAGNDRDVPEIVWGLGVARWNWEGAKALDMPIIEQPCELLLESDGALVITPRLQPPAINLKPFRAIGLDEVDHIRKVGRPRKAA